MRKITLLLGVGLLGLSLTGCGNQASKNTASSSSQVSANAKANSAAKANQNSQSSSSESSTSQGNNHQTHQLWNADKDAQLATFMNQFGAKMNQSYTKYDGQNPMTTQVGLTYPDSLSRVRVNGTNSSIGWAPTGEGNYDYNVVAIYNYDRSGDQVKGPMRVTYYFAFHNGQPVALADQTTNGDELYAMPTKNPDVAAAFSRIAK